MTRLYISAAILAALIFGYFTWASHIEQKGFDRAVVIHEKQMAELAKKAVEQKAQHQTQMREAELDASKKIAQHQANTRTAKAKLYESTKNLDDCRLSTDAIRMLNNSAAP